MIKYILLVIIFFNSLQSETFEEKQKTLQDIRSTIQYEESIARTYEQYILDEHKLPSITEINTLLGGSLTSFVTTITSNVTNTTLSSDITKLSYALGDTLKTDVDVKKIYDSSIFRKRTYVRNDAVYFILEDKFAKHLFDLIAFNNNTSDDIKPCASGEKVCIANNHIYIEPTYSGSNIDKYLMSYHVDKFETGPFVITEDTTKHNEDIFKSIPKGILIYDTTGRKYVKTTSGIEILK